MTALVGDGYHYIRNDDGQEELFDLENDPKEQRDLAHSADRQGVIRRLHEFLETNVLNDHRIGNARGTDFGR
jgi:hypothetical protein